MKTYEQEKALISIHIPKCSGTSLRCWLEQAFPGQVFLHYFDEKNNLPPVKHELRNGRVIHGHFNRQRGFGIQDYYPEADQFITFLRDPFDMVVSRFFYEKQLSKRGESFRDGQTLHLPEEVDCYLRQEINNPRYVPNLLDYLPEDINAGNYQEFFERKFIYVGVVEELSKSLRRLAKKLGISAPPTPHLNPSDHYQQALEPLQKEFVATHPLEYQIYQYALSHYDS